MHLPASSHLFWLLSPHPGCGKRPQEPALGSMGVPLRGPRIEGGTRAVIPLDLVLTAGFPQSGRVAAGPTAPGPAEAPTKVVFKGGSPGSSPSPSRPRKDPGVSPTLWKILFCKCHTPVKQLPYCRIGAKCVLSQRTIICSRFVFKNTALNQFFHGIKTK